MSFSYEEWKKKDNNRRSKRPLTKVPKFDDWKASRPSRRVEENKPYGGTSIEQFRFDAQPKTDKARQADSDRFARGHKDFRASARDVANQLDAQGPQSDKARRADDERFAGRYTPKPKTDKARQADTDRYAKQYKASPRDIANQQALQAPKSAQANQADAARFGGGYQRKEVQREETARQADSDRFAGRYESEQKKIDLETMKRTGSPFLSRELPGVHKKSEPKVDKPSILQRVFDNAKSNLDKPGFHERKLEMEHQGESDMIKGFFNADNVNDTLSEKAGANLRLGTGDAVESVAGGMRWLSKTGVIPGGALGSMFSDTFLPADLLQKGADKIRDGFEDSARKEEFEYADWNNPEWLATELPRAAPQLLVSLMPSLAIAGAAGKLAKIQKLPKLFRALIPPIAGGGGQAVIDSTLEAGGAFDEAIRRGMTEDEARKVGNQVFGDNFKLNSGIDIVQFALMLSPLKKIDKLGKIPSIALRSAGGAVAEGFQEGAQSGITANALGDEFNWTDPSTVEAILLGAILGGGVTATVSSGKAMVDSLRKEISNDSPVPEILDRAVDELPPEIRAEFDQAVTDLEEQGMPKADAMEIVAEQLINRVPEFQSVIEAVVKDYINDKKLERQSKETNPVTQEQENLTKAQANPETEINPTPNVQPEMNTDTSLEVPNVPQGIPNVPNNVIAPPTIETPAQASKEPLDVQVGDSISLQGTRPETEYVVEGVEGNSVTLQTPNKKTIRVPKSSITKVLDRKAIEEALSDEVDYDYDADNMFDDDVEQPTSNALPPDFRKALRADLHDMVNNEGATIDEAVAGLKSDEYYADNPEWQKLIEEEAKAFGYKGEQPTPQQTQPKADKPWKKKEGEYRQSIYDAIAKKIKSGSSTQDYWEFIKKSYYKKGDNDLQYPETENIKDALIKNGILNRDPHELIILTKEDEKFHKESVARHLKSSETNKEARYEDWKKIGREFMEKYDLPTVYDYAKLFSRVSTQAKEEGKSTLVSDMFRLADIDFMFQELMDDPSAGTVKSAPVKKGYASKFEVGDTVYQATLSGTAEESIIVGKDDKEYTISPVRDMKYKWMSPFGLPDVDQDLYADKTEAENAAKVKKEVEDKRYHDFITGKDSGREPSKVKLIDPIGKNKETGRPIYKYNLIGKKWIVIPLNAPRTVNGEQNAKKAYLHIRRGYNNHHGKVSDDMAIVDKGTIYIGSNKDFVWEGKNIHDVFPDIPPYNVLNISEIEGYLAGEIVQFKNKEEEDAKLEAGKIRAEQNNVKRFEEGDPNAIYNHHKEEWNNLPFEATHQRILDRPRLGREYKEIIQVIEFETPKGTYFTRRTESIPFINPAPIDVLKKLAIPISEVPKSAEPLPKAEPETPSAKKPPLTAIDKSKPFPKVTYKEATTRITATFKPVKKYWDKEEPLDMTLIFPKDKDGFLGMPKHDGRSASVTDVNDWLNINYYQEGVTAKELTETFDFMNNTQEDEIVYSKDYTHELIHNGIKIKTFFRPDGMVHWIDENGNIGKSVTSPAHMFRAVKIPTGEEKKKQDAKEAEIVATIKKNFKPVTINGIPRGLFTTGIGSEKLGFNGGWSHEQERQYRLNQKTILSLMTDEDVLNYVAVHYGREEWLKKDMEELEKLYYWSMKDSGSADGFMWTNTHGSKGKVVVEMGDGRKFNPTKDAVWKRFKALLEAKTPVENEAPTKKPTAPKQETKAPKEPTNVKADDKYAKMRDRLEFADKAAAAARKRLESRRNTLYSGLPMNDYVDLSIIGMTKLAHKMVDLAEFTESMVKEFGENRRVWIPGVYAQATAMLDYDEPTVTKMLQDAYNDDSMTLIEEETTTSIEEPTNGETNTKLQEYEALMKRIQDEYDYDFKGKRTKEENDARNELVQQGWKLAEEVPHWGYDVGEVVERRHGRGWKRDTILEIDKGQIEFKSISIPYTSLRKVAVETETETKPETNATSEYASLGYLEPKPQKRSARNGQFTTDEIIMFDLLGDTEIPSFLKAIFAESDPRLVNDLYLKLMVSRGREVKIDGKEFNERYNAPSDATIDDYRQNLLGYGRGLDEDGEEFQVLIDPSANVYVSYPNKKQNSIELPYPDFKEAMKEDEYSFGKVHRPLWVGNIDGFLKDLNARGRGGKDVSNIIGTGSVPNGAPTKPTQNADGGKPTSEVSTKGEGRPEGSSERTNDGITDGVPDSRDGQPEGSTGDTITSPSNHGNPTERVVPVDHVITENIYEPSPKKRFANNIKALEILKTLETENRYGTASELELLAKYQGWGGLSDYFDRRKPEQYQALIDHVDTGLISQKEYEAMRKTVETSFYTSHEIAKTMYDVLLSAGFNGGKILESSAGTGMLLGALPKLEGKHKFETVEIDELSYRITSKLYPNQKHHNKGFQIFSATEGSFDVVIGNVPFSDNRIIDKTYTDSDKTLLKDENGKTVLDDEGKKVYRPKGKLDHDGRLMDYATRNTHDYFLVKNLDLLKEGGLGVLITSSSSLNSRDWKGQLVREYFEANTDFLEVIRLPNDAFKHAGTSVTTDILFFRKKVKGSKFKPSPITKTGELNYGDVKGTVNEYFLAKPDQITGELKQGTRYGDQLIVTMDNYARRMKKAVSHVTKVFKGKFVSGGVNNDVPVVLDNFVNEQWAKEKIGAFDGAIHYSQGMFFQYTYKQWKPFKVEKENIQKLKDALAVRDSYLALIVKEENKAIPSEQMQLERKKLNDTYDKFVKEHGEMNKSGVLTPFEEDVRTIALLRSLEKKVGKKWEKVDIFRGRQKFPDIKLDKKGDVKQALNLSLIHRGELDLNVVSDLIGKSKEDTIEQLENEGHIFFDPQEQAYVTDDEYLSGNIAKKIALAKAKDLQRNIAALEKILPTQLSVEQVVDGIRFGQGWIPKEVYADFVTKVIGLRDVVITHNFQTASWGIKTGNGYSHKNDQTYAINHKYAKRSVTGVEIVEKLMNMKSPKPPLNIEYVPASLETQSREEILNITNRVVEQLQNEFKAFIIGHPKYNEQLTTLYNDTFTSVVPRVYDGERMYGTDEQPTSIPNLNPVYKLYKHQKDAVMRVLRSQNSLLAHVVGAGKSLEMQVAIMEGRRLGIIKKPMMVVPNFMVEQASREFQHAYPNAKIKVITTGKTENDIAGIKISRNSKWSDEKFKLETDKNRMLRFRSLADVKYGDYDVVIMSYTSFERVSLDPESETDFVHREVEALRSYMTELVSEDGKSPTVKEIEKAITKLETRLEELAARDKKDVAMSFEEIGIDALFVDEAQSYKNLQYHTKLGSVGGLPNSSSNRAFDMYMKTFVMNRQGGRTVFATGTPISNSMAEMYTLLRYLAPDTLEAQGLTHFDGWAQLFGTTENSVELNTAGKFVEKTRFSKFTNVGELMRIFKSFADVKMADDLPYLKRPKVERITITTGMSDKQQTYLELMVRRAGNVAGGIEPFMDNLLKLTGEGKKLALDYRLFDGSAENDPNSKLNRIAEQVAEEYKANATGNIGTDPDGKEFTFDNGTQIVFMDMGVPKATDNKKDDDSEDDDTDNVDASMYQNLKDRLLKLGVKNEHIAFIHDYNKPDQKKKLSELFNEGTIRVLIGSTGKMGVGMNLQKRLTTLHHADPTWRPSDIEQREGRIVRQGNWNSSVNIKTYVTEGSFDALMWNTLENKAKFIAQVMSGGTEIRSMDEIAELIMSFSEIKASATGNLSMIELMKTEKRIRELQLDQREFSKKKGKAAKTIEDYKAKKKNLQEILEFVLAIEGKAKPTRGAQFHLVMDDKTFTDRTDGIPALRDKVLAIRKEKRTKEYAEKIGELGNVPIIASGRREVDYRSPQGYIKETIVVGEIQDGVAFGYGFVPTEDFVSSEGRGGMSRLENVVMTLAAKQNSPTTKEKLAELEVAYKEAQGLVTQTFEHTDALLKMESDVISLREDALQHELTNTFDTVFTKDGNEFVVTGVKYREVPSKNKKKQKEDKPDYEIDVHFTEVIGTSLSSEPDVFGVDNEAEYEIYKLGDSEVVPVIDFVRDYNRANNRKGVTEGVADARRFKAEEKRKQDAADQAGKNLEDGQINEFEEDDSDISSLLDLSRNGGTDNVVSPKVAKQVGDLLANALNTIIQSGYVEGRRGKKKGKKQAKALGTFNFDKGTGNVRNEHVHNLRVVAHELGHAFERFVGLDQFESLRDDLESIAAKLYPNGAALEGDTKMKEGLAELFQLYVIDPAAAEQLAPEATEFLKKFIEGDPALKKAFAESSKIVAHEAGGDVINKVLGSINFADDSRITKDIGDGYSLRGGANATARQRIKGFIKEQIFEVVDFTLPFKDMRKELKTQGYEGLDIVKKLATSGQSRERARHEFTNWASDKYTRKIINYETVDELPNFLQEKYEELMSGIYTGDHDYIKRFKRFMKTDTKERAALKALSSRSFQEISVDGIMHIEEKLRKSKDIPQELQRIIDSTDTDVDGKKKEQSSYRIFSGIAQAYRYKERSERVDENGKKKFTNNPINESDAQKLIDLSRQYFPKLENLIEEYTNNLSEVLLTKAVEGGLITQKTKETVKKGSKFYIPTYYASKFPSLDGNDSDRKSAGQPVNFYQGKQEVILDVLQATINKLTETEAAVEFKTTMDILQASLKTKGMGRFGSFIRPQVVPHVISGKQIESQLIDFISESTGIDASDMEGSLSNAVFNIFIKTNKDNSHEPILINWKYDKDGKAVRTYMKVAPDLYNSILSMQPLQFGLYTRALSRMSSVFRYLALANVKYLITAFQRDTSTAFLQRDSKGGISTYIKNTVKGMGYAAGVDEKIVDQYMASGAFSSNTENVLKSFSRKNMTDGLLPDGSKMFGLIPTGDPSLWKTKNGKFIKFFNPSSYLTWGESVFRFGEFNATVNEMLAEEGVDFSYQDFMDGSVKLDDKDKVIIERILLEAGYRASQITVNFNGHGRNEDVRKVFNPISFLHGAVQGTYREAEEIKNHGFNKSSKRLTYRMMGTLLPMTLATWALSRVMGDDEEEIPSEMRDKNWMIWTPFGYYAYAKPFAYSVPDAYVERFLDDTLGEEGARKYYEDALNPLKTLVHLPYMPILFNTISDLYHNETWYGGEIVPKYEEDKPDYQQFNESTSTLAKKQAEMMFIYRNKLEGVTDPKDANYEYGISPKKFDYAITSLFGKWGAAFLETVGGKPKNDTLLVGSMITGEDEIRSRSVDKFYKKAANVDAAHASFGVKNEPDEGTKMFRKMKDTMGDITDLQKAIHASPNISKAKKSEMNLNLVRAKRDIARVGIKIKPKDKENVQKTLNMVGAYQDYVKSQEE